MARLGSLDVSLTRREERLLRAFNKTVESSVQGSHV